MKTGIETERRISPSPEDHTKASNAGAKRKALAQTMEEINKVQSKTKWDTSKFKSHWSI